MTRAPDLTALTPEAAHRALASRDARFDGRFVVGVTSTRIYCRPVCRVRVPKLENCRFYAHAAQAEQAGFRPCLRCRPELAPGWSTTDATHTLARAGARLIERAVAEGQDANLKALSRQLGVTDRHFRRIFQLHFGVTPMAWLTTQRLLLAKQLLTDSPLPVQDVALASGFGSVRRLHAAFSQHYRITPGDLRRQAEPSARDAPTGVRLKLAWRPPLDIEALQRFLHDRPLPGVEAHHEGTWHRTLALTHQGHTVWGWLSLQFRAEQQQVWVDLSPSLAPAMGAVSQRLRHLLDLDADPQAIHEGLHRLAPHLPQGLRPGLRLPGCMDGFETTVRIVLGQQVSVAAACTLAGRLVQRFGVPVATPLAGLTHLFPTASALARASAEDIGALGIVRSRVVALQSLARAVDQGQLDLSPAPQVEPTLHALAGLPGVGPWTCDLVALRVLAWPDAFPVKDLGVLKALGTPQAAQAQEWSQAWRPWRSYAVMQLWHALLLPPFTPSPEPSP